MTVVQLAAPCRGWLSAIATVPDAVFAERMLGDGFAIDPLDTVICSPCDATVIAIAPTLHSITLELANGAHVMIHIGLETVALAGQGFTMCVAVGAIVRTGSQLVTIDLERIAAAGKNLVTPVVVVNEGFALRSLVEDGLVEQGRAICSVSRSEPVAERTIVNGDTTECDITVPLVHGIHARPAAQIAALLKPLTADVRIVKGTQSANARSTTALMALAVQHNDVITLSANGPDAREAVVRLVELIESGMGERKRTDEIPVVATHEHDVATSASILTGVRASPGFAVGPAYTIQRPVFIIPSMNAGIVAETAALTSAIECARADLSGSLSPVASAHLGIVEDPDLARDAVREIVGGANAAQAWQTAISFARQAMLDTGNMRMAERTADLSDIEHRVLSALLPEIGPGTPPPADSIIFADDLLPSQFSALSSTRIAGIVTAYGGPTSHVAIMAAAAGIPMIVAVGDRLATVAAGTIVVIDADAAFIDIDPSEAVTMAMRARVAQMAESQHRSYAAAQNLCRTADGVRIEVFANLGSVSDADRAVAAGAEGCGLLRTEFLFLDRQDAPTEAEQRAVYADIAKAMQGHPLIVRTLDIGTDKPVAYVPMPREDNPALGLRGIRLGLARPALLMTQLRAIAAGVPHDQCRVMLPMIVDRDELRRVRLALDEACCAVGQVNRIPLGVMIETPSAALMIDTIATEADFISIGTNDLSQYVLAADRGNAAVAGRIDAFHPAVLRMIEMAAQGAAAHDKCVGVCGSLASDPVAAPLLIGLGVTELSVAPAAIPAIKARVAMLTIAQCQAVAAKALQCATAHEVHAMLKRQ